MGRGHCGAEMHTENGDSKASKENNGREKAESDDSNDVDHPLRGLALFLVLVEGVVAPVCQFLPNGSKKSSESLSGRH